MPKGKDHGFEPRRCEADWPAGAWNGTGEFGRGTERTHRDSQATQLLITRSGPGTTSTGLPDPDSASAAQGIADAFQQVQAGVLEWASHESDGQYKMAAYAGA